LHQLPSAEKVAPSMGSGSPGLYATPPPPPIASPSSAPQWDLTAAQARDMGLMGNEACSPPQPPSTAGSAPGSSPPSSGGLKSAGPARKVQLRHKPSVSIPAGSPPPASAYASASAAAMSTPVAAVPAPLMSPSRARNPRVSIMSTPTHAGGAGGGGFGRDPAGTPMSAAAASDDSNYTLSVDLQPFPSAPTAAEIASVLKGLQSADWSTRFDSITSLRRLVVHHPSSLGTTHTKALVRDLKSELNSLRSSLAKNALMALADIFGSGVMARLWEAELEQLAPSMLKRAGESSGFLREEAHRALLAMLSSCSDRFTLPLLLNAAATGTKNIKIMAVVYLDRLVEVCAARPGGQGVASLQNNKEFPRLLKAIGSFASDAAVESRTHSKWSLIRLARIIGLEELDRTLSRALPPAHYHSVAKVFSKGMDQLVLELMAAQRQVGGDPLGSPSSAGPMGSPAGTGSLRQRERVGTASHARGVAGGGGLFATALQDASALDSTGDSLGSSGGGAMAGTESKRAPRRKAALLNGSPSPPMKGSAGGGDEFGTDSWSSVRSVAGGGGSNLFDLNAGPTGSSGEDFFHTQSTSASSASSSVSSSLASSPPPVASSASAASTPGPRTAGKRRPTMSAGPGLGGGAGATGASAPAPSAADTERLNTVLSDLSSGDWRLRLGGLEKLTAFLSVSPGAAAYHAPKIFDQLAQRISDHHGKVNVAALQSLQAILPLSRSFLPQVLASFLPVLASHLASTSPVIRQLSQTGLEQLVSVLDSPRSSFSRDIQMALLAPLCQVALFESVKVRPAVIQLLTGVLDSAAEHLAESGAMPSIGTFKAALPVCYALVDEQVPVRSEVRAPLLRCAQTMYALVGAALWDDKLCMQFHIQPAQVQKLRTVLGV